MDLLARDRRAINDYLLGTTTPTVAESIEIRLFTDSAFAEELDIAEDELCADYVLGDMSPYRAWLFEQNFLVGDFRARKLAFIRALIHYANHYADARRGEELPVDP